MSVNAVEVEGLSLAFGGLDVLQDVTFSVPEGETTGIVGPNGAGKTSLLNCLIGTYRARRGSIRIFGSETTRLLPHRVVGLGVGRTFQNVGAFRDMSVIDFALLGRHTRMGYPLIAYAVGLPIFNGYERKQRLQAMEALEFVGLAPYAERLLADLPYGMIKLADLARTLAMDAQLLLLDEPASGLTQSDREVIVALLKRIRDEKRMTQIVIEHNMGVATALCSNLVALSSGRLIAHGPTAEVLRDPAVITAFLGTAEEESRAGVTE